MFTSKLKATQFIENNKNHIINLKEDKVMKFFDDPNECFFKDPEKEEYTVHHLVKDSH